MIFMITLEKSGILFNIAPTTTPIAQTGGCLYPPKRA